MNIRIIILLFSIFSILNPINTLCSTNKIEHLVFIDQSLTDYQFLENSVNLASSQVILLNPKKFEGIRKMTDEIKKYQQLKSIHIVGHGNPAEIKIGSNSFWSEDLYMIKDFLKLWTLHTTEDADLILYGCSIAKGEIGQKFIKLLADLTHMDVSASENITGHKNKYGDWKLEAQVGKIETSLAFSNDVINYPYSLQGLNYADLRNYTQVNEGSSAGAWSFPGESGRTAYQSNNTSQPIYLLSSEEGVINRVFKGTIRLDPNQTDDDDIGFALGYQDYNNTIIWSWDAGGIYANDGSHRLYHKTQSASWNYIPGTELATGTSNDPWANDITYQFEILYTSNRIRIKVDGTEKFNVTASQTNFSEFPSGRFGFYNYSQSDVTFGNVQSAPGSDIQVPPTAQNDNYGTAVDQQLIVDKFEGIAKNDYDANLDTYSIQLVSNVSNGTLNLNTTDGNFSYTPNSGYEGGDSFTYKLVDSANGNESAVATVKIGVINSNQGPTNITLSNNTIGEGSANNSVVGQFTTTDANIADIHDYTLLNSAAGRFTVNGDELVIANSSLITAGTYDIEVKSTDLFGLSTQKTFSITVETNNSPTSANGSVSINSGISHTFSASDFTFSDPDGDTFGGIRIESIETQGDLEYNSSDVFAGTLINDITQLVFKTVSNGYGSPYATFTFKVKDNRGKLSNSSYTMSINVASPFPTLNAGTNSSPSYLQGGSSVLIAPNFTISNAGSTPLQAMKVYFTDGHFSNQDELTFVDQNGISGAWNQSSGVLTLTGSASAATYQTAIRSITYTNTTSGSANAGSRTIEYAMGNATAFSGNNHYYEYVAGARSWQDANNEAHSKSYFGLQGYLATITSAQENKFIKVKLGGNGWIGCSDADTENTWKWVTGPEAGMIFWKDGNPLSGQYSNWATGEPNDAGSTGEDYGHIYVSNGNWNDFYHGNPSIHGYIVEYGGSAGDPPSSNLTTTSTVTVVPNSPPVAVNDTWYIYPGVNSTFNVIDGSGSNGTPDSDPDNNPISVTTWSALSSNIGTISNTESGGNFDYSAPTASVKNYSHDVTFTYLLSDSKVTATGNVTLSIVTPTWSGTADFSTPANWNGAVVPSNNLRNDIIINSGQLSILDNREVRHLTLNNNATLIVGSTGTLHIYGDLINLNAINDKIIIQNGGKIFLHGDLYYNGEQKISNSTIVELNSVLDF